MIDRRGFILTITAGVAGLGGMGFWLFRNLFSSSSYMSGAAQLDPVLQSEREQQVNLPHADDPLWPLLSQCKVTFNKDTGVYSLKPTREVSALIGKTIRVSGFIVPLDGSDRPKDFLVGVNTPICFYHPPGEPNEVIEARSVDPIVWTDKPISIEGRFTQISNGELGVFFRLDNARAVP